MTPYNVTAEREGKWWFVSVDGVGATQARNHREVAKMAKDLISVMREVPADSIELVVRFLVPDEARQHMERASQLRELAGRSQAEAAAEARAAARALSATGMTVRDIGAILGVSHQRAQQLLHEPHQHKVTA
jgi:hypothetical protein